MSPKTINIAPVPLAHKDWKYVEKRTLEEYRAEDWEILEPQRAQYFQEQQAEQVLRMLTCQANDKAYVYPVNNYYHSLLTATRMLKDDLSEEDVVVGLLHDVGFITCNATHGEFAAALMRPYISARNHWMLVHHGVFQQVHCHELPGCDRNARDKWRGHPHFDWTAEFVEKYDQSTISNDEDIIPVEEFEPMVRRFFSKDPVLGKNA
jgi:predicted HD phosphohydrolase